VRERRHFRRGPDGDLIPWVLRKRHRMRESRVNYAYLRGMDRQNILVQKICQITATPGQRAAARVSAARRGPERGLPGGCGSLSDRRRDEYVGGNNMWQSGGAT
jgi:hypothetical protein